MWDRYGIGYRLLGRVFVVTERAVEFFGYLYVMSIKLCVLCNYWHSGAVSVTDSVGDLYGQGGSVLYSMVIQGRYTV